MGIPSGLCQGDSAAAHADPSDLAIKAVNGPIIAPNMNFLLRELGWV